MLSRDSLYRSGQDVQRPPLLRTVSIGDALVRAIVTDHSSDDFCRYAGRPQPIDSGVSESVQPSPVLAADPQPLQKHPETLPGDPGAPAVPIRLNVLEHPVPAADTRPLDIVCEARLQRLE